MLHSIYKYIFFYILNLKNYNSRAPKCLQKLKILHEISLLHFFFLFYFQNSRVVIHILIYLFVLHYAYIYYVEASFDYADRIILYILLLLPFFLYRLINCKKRTHLWYISSFHGRK